MIRRSIVTAALAGAVACGGVGAPAPAPSPVVRATVLDAEPLRRDVFAFAADSFRGRETGSTDARRAASFIARRLMELGLEPAGDSLYFQRVPLTRTRYGAGTRFEVTDASGTRVLELGKVVLPLTSLGPGAPEPKRNAMGDLVFAGYGIQSQELGRNDFQGVDLRGRAVVVIHGAPRNASGELKKQLESQQQLSERIGRLIQQQPAAIIMLMNEGTEGFYDQLASSLARQVSARGAREAPSDAQRPLPMILLGVASGARSLLPAGWPADDKAQALTGKRFSGRVELVHEPIVAHNVVAVVRGTDPRLNRSYVAYGAHYDHIGIQRSAGGDSIANGADDDASGSMALLTVARMMQAAPPRRSVLFVWHVGEEKGLLGSAYFTEHPTVPIDSIVAQINADMIGRNAPESLYVVGPNAAPNGQSRVLGRIVDSMNTARAQPFRIDREWDSPDHPEQIYQRSDHFNYARKGIPIVFFTTGLHADYHRVSDDPSKIDYGKLANVTALLFDVGKAVGNREQRPR